MASTVKDEIDRANPNYFADVNREAKTGTGLGQCVVRSQQLVVAANLATPDLPAREIIKCHANAAGAPGYMAVAAPETTPAAGNCAVSPLGQIEFAAADAVTECDVDYVPVEGELVTETIPVTAGGVGTFLQAKSCKQIVTATLNAPAATPAAKTVAARGTLVGALAAGQCAVQFAGTTLQFVAAEAGVACTATVSYYAMPHVGTAEQSFGERLDGAYTP